MGLVGSKEEQMHSNVIGLRCGSNFGGTGEL